MPNKRQERFFQAVAEAAISNPPTKPRGRPTPDNLTEEGRSKGLTAMQSSKRCKGVNRSGTPCRAPAMRGSKRCLKHGGRVEVPAHPHNIRRFFSGNTVSEKSYGSGELSDQEHWEQLPYRLRREVLDILPRHVITNLPRLYLAARVWMEVREANYPAMRRFIDTFIRH